MEFYFILIMLSTAINLVFGNTSGICSKTSNGKPLQCCENYRQVGDACEECWPGTYGLNCTPCPKGFYGRLCRESCNQCTPCDPVIGCASPESSPGLKGIDWLIIAILVTGLCGVGFTVFMFNYCKLRTKEINSRLQMNSSTTEQPKGENGPFMTSQNQNDSINEYGEIVEFGAYNTLNLKNRDGFNA